MYKVKALKWLAPPKIFTGRDLKKTSMAMGPHAPPILKRRRQFIGPFIAVLGPNPVPCKHATTESGQKMLLKSENSLKLVLLFCGLFYFLTLSTIVRMTCLYVSTARCAWVYKSGDNSVLLATSFHSFEVFCLFVWLSNHILRLALNSQSCLCFVRAEIIGVCLTLGWVRTVHISTYMDLFGSEIK